MLKRIVALIILLGVFGGPALATMSNTSARETLFTGDGSTTEFAFTFPIINTSDLEVWLRTTSTGDQAQQTETTHYSLSATNNDYSSGGTVTMVTAPASTQKLLLLRATPQTQNSDIGASGVLLTLEKELDKQQRQLIDLQEAVNRCPKFPETDATTLSSQIPNSVSRASQFFGFNSSGEPTIIASGITAGSPTVSPFGETLIDDADAAEARGTLELDATDDVEFAAITGTTGTFSDALSATTGTFSGAVSGTTGTFSGALSATTGTFSDAVSGTTGTFSGVITANGGVVLGAGDDLVGSSTSDVNIGGNFTVAGATGNTVIAGTLDVTGNINPTTYETTNGGFLDEDDMASNSATKVTSQQGVKTYIDTGSYAPAVKGWINFDGDTGTARSAFNATVSRTATGKYTITWGTDFADNDYALAGFVADSGLAGYLTNGSSDDPLAVGSVTVETRKSSDAALTDFNLVTVIAVGTQ